MPRRPTEPRPVGWTPRRAGPRRAPTLGTARVPTHRAARRPARRAWPTASLLRSRCAGLPREKYPRDAIDASETQADTWWQTETGVIQIAPTMAAGAGPHKPGAAMTPVAGCVPALLDAATGAEIPAVIGEEAKGLLVLKQPWPSMARTCWGDHERFENTYFSYDGYYLTGDGARRDADGHYWITGRVDDVVVVSGHNIGTAEVESALVAHPAVSFCGVPLPFLLRAPLDLFSGVPTRPRPRC